MFNKSYNNVPIGIEIIDAITFRWIKKLAVFSKSNIAQYSYQTEHRWHIVAALYEMFAIKVPEYSK